MKALVTAIIMVVSMNAFGAEVVAGTYDKRTDSIALDVVYQGGCKDHNIQVRLNMCNRTLPMTCIADVVDNTEDDVCRAVVHKVVQIRVDDILGNLNVEKLTISGAHQSVVLIDFN
ncbi:MAG: hypothetical protein IT287_06455 [Bdellovibrionaceae bacterium]|nr:hypothetical protein [Pseudobdellovibrionaceae bacterium]